MIRKKILGSLAVLAILTGIAIGPQAAFAESPVHLPSSGIVDQSGALSSDQKSSLEKKFSNLQSRSGFKVYVVYVKSFENPEEANVWAERSGVNSGVDNKSAVIAVATETHKAAFVYGRQYTSQFGASQMRSIYQKVYNEFQSGDWYGMGEVGLDSIAQKAGVGESTSGASSWVGVVITIAVIVLFVALLGGILLFVFLRRKKRAGIERNHTAGVAGPPQADGQALVPLPQLERQAGGELVRFDDLLQSSEQELMFAEAEFGADSTHRYRHALDDAKKASREAFGLKQQLDDEIPDSPEDRRRWSERIIAICAEGTQRIQAESQSFEELRGLEQNLPEHLEKMTANAESGKARIQQAEERIHALTQRYSDHALAPIVQNPAQARELLEFISTTGSQATEAMRAGNTGAAAAAVRRGEQAAQQIGTLMDAVDKHAQSLEMAERAIPQRMDEISNDAAQGKAWLDAEGRGTARAGEIAAAVAGAEQAIEYVKGQQSGRTDPTESLNALQQAGSRLRGLLDSLRASGDRERTAAQNIDGAIQIAQARIDTARDFITTRRGVVGEEARTKLAAAERAISDAQASRANSPVRAQQAADAASSLAQQALDLAGKDVENGGAWDDQGFDDYRSYRNRGYRRYRDSYGYGGGSGGAMLGGLLTGLFLGNMGGHDSGWNDGGFGGGFGGGFDGGGFGGGSFDGGGGGDFSGGGFDFGGGDFGGGGTDFGN